MNKVNNIIQILQRSYDKLSDEFHTHFQSVFNKSIVSNTRLNSHEQFLNYNHNKLNKYIDKCVNYRLGISDTIPKEGDIIYDLSSSLSPELFEESVDQIFSEIVYCAFPPDLTSLLRQQLEAHKLNDDVIDLIMSKLEYDQK